MGDDRTTSREAKITARMRSEGKSEDEIVRYLNLVSGADLLQGLFGKIEAALNDNGSR